MKPIKVMLDIERELKFGSKSFVVMEKLAGKPMDKINFEGQEIMFIMLGAGLSHSYKNITLDKVYDIVDKTTERIMEEEGLNFMEAYAKVAEIVSKMMEEVFPSK